MSESETKKFEEIEDSGIRAFLIESDRFYPADAANFTMAEQRDFYDRLCAHFRKPLPASVKTLDIRVGSVPCRQYRKRGTTNAPVMVYFHGGGFVLGSLDSHDSVCAEICDGAEIDVVAVDYRLAPEHPFPAAFDDCWAVLEAVGTQHDRLIVGGDSAGGNLAAAVALKARDKGGPALRGQVLIYPGLGGDTAKGSYVSQAHAPGLTTADVEYYANVYQGGDNKYAAPLRETDYSGLPPAFCVAAAIDPHHDASHTYADRLMAAGVPVQVRDEPRLVHGFLRARDMSQPARQSFDAIISACHTLAHHGTLPDMTTHQRIA